VSRRNKTRIDVHSQRIILVIPRSLLGGFIEFRGFQLLGETNPETWISQCQFKPRSEMETDPSFKQLIPYILVRREDRIFRYRRTKRAGESRLHHLYSIGIGGHINLRDENLFSASGEILLEAALRELREEVDVESPVELRPIGFINDDETDVGQVHLGLVYEAWVESERIEIRESALSRGEWIRIDELDDGVEYEGWSQFVIEQYLRKK